MAGADEEDIIPFDTPDPRFALASSATVDDDEVVPFDEAPARGAAKAAAAPVVDDADDIVPFDDTCQPSTSSVDGDAGRKACFDGLRALPCGAPVTMVRDGTPFKFVLCASAPEAVRLHHTAMDTIVTITPEDMHKGCFTY